MKEKDSFYLFFWLFFDEIMYVINGEEVVVENGEINREF